MRNDDKQLKNLTEGWPEAAQHDGSIDFARRLIDATPPLDEKAMDWVEFNLPVRRRWMRFTGYAAAAMVLLVVGLWVWSATRTASTPMPAPPVAQQRVHAEYRIAATALPPPPVPDKPLLRVDEYQALLSSR